METFGKYISYKEATKSEAAIRAGIPNIPGPVQLQAMHLVAEKVFDRVREHFKVRIGVTSFFRSHDVNKLIGGAPTSQHINGEAIDIDADVYGSVKNSAIFHFIKDNLDFDQLIWEFGDSKEPAWVHVSYKAMNRRSILIGKKDGGRTIYVPYR